MQWVGVAFLCVAAAGLAWIAILIFRSGRRGRYLGDIPLLRFAFYAMLPTLGRWLLMSLTGLDSGTSFKTSTLAALIFFAMATSLWLLGFAFGRRKKPPANRILPME